MSGAFPLAKMATGALLCLWLLAPRARAAENLPPSMTDEKTAPLAIVSKLQKNSEGLQMPSETDAPFEVVYFALETVEIEAKSDRKETGCEGKTPEKADSEVGKVTAQKIAELAGAPANATVETRDLEGFFKVATTVEDWMNAEEKATAGRFAALLETLKTELKETQVVVWGDAEKRVAIVGKCEGGLAGVTTLIVET